MGGLRRNRRVGFALMFFVSFGQGFGLQQPATFTATRARKVPPRRRPKGGMGPLPRTTTRRWPRLENDKLGFFSIHSVPRTLSPRQTAISYGLHESEGNGTYNGRILDGSQSFDVKTKFHERCDGLDVELALDLAKSSDRAFVHVPDHLETLENLSDTLDNLQKSVHDLEREVEELRREESKEIFIGTCRFAREGGTRNTTDEGRDLLLYLPGVDGLMIEAADQFDFLSASFDTWCMTVQSNDKSTFQELTAKVLEFLHMVGVADDRQAVIVGSSFGGLLAVNVAHQRQAWIKGLVLVNPATSYGRSNWRTIGSLVANAPGSEAFGVAATLALVTTVPDTAMVSRYMSEFEALPAQEVAVRLRALAKEWLGRLSSLFSKTPQEQLQWRLKNWLEAGSKRVEPLLRELSLPVLVLAGSEDHMLPSVDEATRLSELIPTCQQIILRGVGHAALNDPGKVNLCSLLQSSVLYDKGLLDRITKGKEAKKAPKRWQQVSSGSIADGGCRLSGKLCGSDASDPVLDFKLDMDDELVSLAWRSTQAMDRFTSPVFLSLNERGQLEEGLGGVPDHTEGRSILFVGNHQLLGIDMPILVRKVLAEKDILMRGLAHPVVTGAAGCDFIDKLKIQQEARKHSQNAHRHGIVSAARGVTSSIIHAVGLSAGRMETSGLRSVKGVFGDSVKTLASASSLACRVITRNEGFRRLNTEDSSEQSFGELVGHLMAKLGAVPVTPRNMFKLLKAGESVLLYPGGAKEALHRKGQAYQMFWPEKSEFVRMAASCNALIVPFAAIGSADSAEILMDLDEIFSLPFGLGETMLDAADLIPRARYGDDTEYFLPPLARPKVPARHYFVFGKAIDTASVDEKDRDACQRVYNRTRSSVGAGIEYLLEAREHDPYRHYRKRLLYESVMRTQAPTFPLDAATFDGIGQRP